MSIRPVLLLLCTLVLAATALRAESYRTTERTVSQVADGVYVIRHPDAPDGFPQGNTTVFIGADAVLVVDSCYLPSAAREDIAQIRQWTDKPVRYLVNTHWHYDHQLGNGAYADAFPGLAIIAHPDTRDQIRGMNPGWFERYPELGARMQKTLDTGIRANGQPLTAEVRPRIEAALKGRLSVSAEFNSRPGRVPNLTFTDELAVDLGGREVRVLHLGRGNTAGDTVVFLPKEGIVAAGDLIDRPVPYIGSGYPRDQIATLQALARLEPAQFVPGHGGVMSAEQGQAHVKLTRDYLLDVTAKVTAAVHKLGNNPADFEKVRAEVEKTVDFDGWRRKFVGDDKENQEYFDGFPKAGAIAAAFAETWPR
jgi:glyoxylase-like metal-dependent hydrolase (beta-lactamase superfamily II)